jgi:hypothetical protein
MNHNIRYELRDPANLEVTTEITKTLWGAEAGGIGPDGVGIGWLDVYMEVFNIERGLWWYNQPGGFNNWVDQPPDQAAVNPAAEPRHIQHYQWRLNNPLVNPNLPMPQHYPFEGLYVSSNFTDGHRKLDEGNAFDTFGGMGWADAAHPNPVFDAGQRGYLIRITADLNNVPVANAAIIEFLHLMPGPIRANVVEVRDSEDAALRLEDLVGPGYNLATNAIRTVEYVDRLEYVGPLAIKTGSFDVDAIAHHAIKDGAIHATALAAGAIHAGTGAPGTEAVAPGAIHASLGGGVPGAIAANAIDAGTIADYAIHDKALTEGAIHEAGGPNGLPAIATGAIHTTAIATDAIHEDTIADYAIHDKALAGGAIHKNSGVGNTPAIANNAIHPTAIASSAIHTTAIATDAIHEDTIADYAIHDKALAENAINENAIAIDSVTYEEISDSAIREIVNGIWNASVFSPIDRSATLDGSHPNMAKLGSMGHAMLVDYISRNMIHVNPAPESGPMATGHGGAWASPMHITNVYDPSGERFYSTGLSLMPLSEAEAKSYIDRTAVLFRGMTVDSGNIERTVRFWANKEDDEADSWEDARLEIFDNKTGSLIETLTFEEQGVGLASNTFSLKPNTQYDWKFHHGTDPGDVALQLYMRDRQSEDPAEPDFVLVPGIQIDFGDLAGGGPTLGTFTTPLELGKTHVQHLVRVTGIGEDEVDGNIMKYFKIQLLDEEQSSIPGGINPTHFGESPDDPITGRYQGDILIIKAETDTTMHEVAHEVWEESVLDHATPDTFGMLNRVVAGLSQFNHQITDSTYDESGRLLACRLVVYSSSEDAKNGENPLTTIEVSSSYDEKQNMTTFVAAEESQE